jgi:MFS transporter, UMF1 family
MCFIFIIPSIYPVASLLTIVAVTSSGCSFVMLNSFLPLLAANHPSVRSLDKRFDEVPVASHEPASPATPKISPASISPALQLSNTISARGIALAYSSAVFVQFCSILILFLASKVTSNTTLPLRMVLFVAGLWWLTFSIPTAFWLRKRPGPPLPSSLMKVNLYTSSRLRLAIGYLFFAWSSLYRTLRLALSLSQVRLFLLAWFLLSDAIATVGSTAILFARTELDLSAVGIACLSITATCSGVAGSVSWPILSRKFGWKTNRIIVLCLCFLEVIPLYGLLYYIPAVQKLGWLGLQQSWEIFPLAMIHGISMGGLSSYCRSYFGQLIPSGHEVAFYALFAITDKGSSAVGPAVVGKIVDATGSIRPAFWFLTVLVALPMLIIGRVDEEKGRLEAVSVPKRGAGDGGVSGGIELPITPIATRDREQSQALMQRND